MFEKIHKIVRNLKINFIAELSADDLQMYFTAISLSKYFINIMKFI